MGRFLLVTRETPVGDAGRLYHAILDHLQPLLWNDVRNAKTCAWMVGGLISTASVALSSSTSAVVSRARCAQSTERRFARWLSNDAIHPTTLYAPLIAQALHEWGAAPLTLALDTSVLFERCCLLRVALVYRGRAVPLAWRVLDHHSAQVGFKHIWPVLAEAKGILDFLGRRDVLLLADRGFVDTDLMRCLLACGWDFHGHLTVHSPLSGKLGNVRDVRDVRLDHGVARFLHGVSLTSEQLGPLHLALAHPDGARDPWFVVGNRPTGLWTFVEYQKRFGTQEHFLDDKSGGFGLEDSQVRDAGMLDRLMLVLAISTLLLVSDGTVREAAGERAAIDAHRAWGLSYFKLGWRGLRRALSWGRPILTALCLVGGRDPAPPRPPTAKQRRPPLDALFHTCWTFDHAAVS